MDSHTIDIQKYKPLQSIGAGLLVRYYFRKVQHYWATVTYSLSCRPVVREEMLHGSIKYRDAVSMTQGSFDIYMNLDRLSRLAMCQQYGSHVSGLPSHESPARLKGHYADFRKLEQGFAGNRVGNRKLENKDA
jgi:hypothetical protein